MISAISTGHIKMMLDFFFFLDYLQFLDVERLKFSTVKSLNIITE